MFRFFLLVALVATCSGFGNRNRPSNRRTAFNRLQQYFRSPNPAFKNFANTQFRQKLTVSELVCQGFFSPDDQTEFNSTADCPVAPVPKSACRYEIRHRTLDGRCNNVENPLHGAAGMPLRHLHEPDDTVDRPNVLAVSSVFTAPAHPYTNTPPPFQSELSMMTLAWSHIVHSDLVNLVQQHSNFGDCLDCCIVGNQDPACDFRITDGEHKCLPYVRMTPGFKPGCPDGPPSAKNLESSFHDLSNVYGSPEDQQRLREYKGGRMRVITTREGNTLPPFEPNIRGACRSTTTPCFDSGNQQVNLLPGATALTGLFLSEHNRVAEALSKINPAWTDEQLFEQARAIVIAEAQHITSNELLPLLIGETNVKRAGLLTCPHEHSRLYDPHADPSVYAAYAVAVSTFYLTSFPPGIVSPRQRLYIVKRVWFDPSGLLRKNAVDDVFGALLQNSPYMVGRIDKDTNEKFLTDDHGRATDLLATLIQLNRDLGIPSYTSFRAACNQSEVTSFAELIPVMGELRVKELEQLYSSVHQIDFIVGGLAEKPLPGALLGRTFACVAASQWGNIKRSDRFWYDSHLQPQALTRDQLSTMQQTTLARLICDNTNIKHIQPKAFLSPDKHLNCPVPCSSTFLPKLDISRWVSVEPVITAPFSRKTIESLLSLGSEVARKEDDHEKELFTQGKRAHTPHKSVRFHASLSRLPRHGLPYARRSHLLLKTTELIVRRVQEENAGKNIDFEKFFKNVELDLSGTVAELPDDECLIRPVPCDHTAAFRTASGWCNNLMFPLYGASFTPLRRLLPATYQDGISAMRSKSKTGRPLPGARLVTTSIYNTHSHHQAKFTHFMMQWGQLIDHDLTLAPISESPEGHELDCSSCDSASTVSINCAPIPIPPHDPHFPRLNDDGTKRCMSFARSSVGQVKLGQREQLNVLTAFVDASAVYGSDDCETEKFRSFTNGRLKSQFLQKTYEEILPKNVEDRDCVVRNSATCFGAGDRRVNEHTGLAAMHTVLMRVHNQYADQLTILNPGWSDERIFQETRKIIGAIVQHITYNEFLPRFVGLKTMDKFGILPLKDGYSDSYSDSCNPGVSTEFATAAYRMGHTLINEMFKIAKEDFDEEAMKPLSKLFFDPSDLVKNNWIAKIMMGMASQHSQAFDKSFADVLMNHLFEVKNESFSGFDLPALNIQRGRDHGIPTYTQIRKLAGLSIPVSFADLAPGIMSERSANALASVYDHVDDIDLFAALPLEHPAFGALVGPTSAWLIAEQFQKTKNCDRFWYENGYQPGSFTLGQLREIRKITLSKILCNTMLAAKFIQPQAFDMPDEFLNKNILCDDIDDLDLTPWKESGVCYVFGQQMNLGSSRQISACVSCTCTKDGRICESMRVHNCVDFIEKNGGQAYLASDPACVAQCGPFFH